MDLLSLLIFLIIVGVMFWAARALSAAFGIPAPIVVVIQVILVVICLVYLLQMLGGGGSLPTIRLGR
jgi:uncharacterized protein YhhL (DUF1145 family)